MRYHAKPYHPGKRLVGSVMGSKKCDRVWEGDNSTCKENASMTVGKCWPRLQSKVKCDQDFYIYYCWWRPLGLHSCGLPSLTPADDDLDCLLLLLLKMIWTAFSCYFWIWSGLPSLATAEYDLDCLLSLLLDCQNLVCLLLLLLDCQDLHCFLSLLLRMIGTAFSCYCRGQSGLYSLLTSKYTIET